jgi:hypothetical protein
MQPAARIYPPRVGRGNCRSLLSCQEVSTNGIVTTQAANGSFQAVGAKDARSREIKIVAGSVIENTIQASRSVWAFVNRLKKRSVAPRRKRSRKA